MNRMKLDQFTNEELIQELATRAPAEALRMMPRDIAKANPPVMVANPDFTRLKSTCQAFIDTISNEGYIPEDDDHYIYEEALTAFFGPDISQWINKFS